LLIVSTLDGYLTALDLNNNGEMVWSVATVPGPMLSSTLSDMELDERGHLVRLIPSLSGKIYKLKDEMVEPIALDASTLLFSSLKMQENLVLTGGKETRTLGIDLKTGEVQYECGMSGDCTQYGVSSPDTLKDVLVVQRVVQTVKAHVPRSGENKWNFSVSLHDVNLYPGVNLCDDVNLEENETDTDAIEDIQFKAVVPEGILCASQKDNLEDILWRRKFQTPLVDVWRIKGDSLEHVNMFSKNTVPKRSSLVDDDDDVEDDENPELYIGIHKKQLYIQESILMHRSAEDAIKDYMLNPDQTEVSMPRVQWKPYLVSPSRTPYFDHGSHGVPLLTSEHHLEGDTVTALAIMDNSAQYPYDAGYYLYSKKAQNDPDNFTENALEAGGASTEESVTVVTVVQYVYTNMWFWWKEIFLISILTAIMMNVLITRPMIVRMRENFQNSSRELAEQFLERQNSLAKLAVKEAVIEKVVEVPSFPQTPSTASTKSFPSVGSELSRQSSDFSSRFLSDFQPVQCLGRGGFGVVFECKNKYDDIHYAVKRITMPSSEENRGKVKREVKLHAKLDHKNVVRYYSTWEETPPVGWQEENDSWWADMELGSIAPTSDPSITDISFSFSRDPDIQQNQTKPTISNHNPLNPFRGFSTSGFSENPTFSKASDNSFAIDFEHSCDNNVPAEEHSNKKVNEKATKKDDSSSSDDEDGSGNESDDEHSDNDVIEESTGGIVFEHTGKSDAVSLDMSGNGSDDENSDDNEEFKVNLGDTSPNSCVEALDWDTKSKQKSSDRTLKTVKQKSFMYIVMQLCLKETLRDWLRLNTVRDKNKIYNIFSQICSGVEYVHSQNLVHRDLKPSNIYFSSDGVIKIGDFGLVTDDKLGGGGDHGHHHEHHHHHHQHTDQVGTLTYMSPEQLQRKPYNHKVDIYSMGLILIELLVPFSTQSERLIKFNEAKKGDLPGSLLQQESSLVSRMLHQVPDGRPEIGDILGLSWLEEVSRRSERRRRDTENLALLDIRDEEILDN